MPVLQNIEYTSHLKREFLREDVDLLIRKYSRKTEKELVVFGVISQPLSGQTSFDSSITETNEGNYSDESMKDVINQFMEGLAVFEDSFSGRKKNEIIIDPIAVYFEV